MENSYKKVLDELDELVELIMTSEEYQTYLNIQQKISKNKKLMKLIDTIKKMQQDFVQKEYYKQNNEQEMQILKELISKLEDFPIYQEYLIRQEDLNNQFQLITTTIGHYFSDEL